MRSFKVMGRTEIIRWRIRGLWAVLALMLVYMVVVGETGGDSRVMTPLARSVSSVIFFGGMGYVIWRIVHNKRLLKSRELMREQLRRERDELTLYLHDKSGGTVMDVMLLALLFATTTAGLFSNEAFYATFALLVFALALKGGTYLYWRGR